MKKLLSILCIISLFVASPIVSAEDEITVTVDGTPVVFDVPPQIINDRTMVPMRAIFEALGATVSWDDENKQALGDLCGILVVFTIDDPIMRKNTIKIPLDTPAMIIDDRTMLPARAVAESFGMQVDWDSNTHTVLIDTSTNTLSVFSTETITYYGEEVNGSANGYGTVYDKETGELLNTGLYKNGELIEGAKYFSNGDAFSGTFVDGKMDKGLYSYSDGSIYVGDINDGYGEMFYNSGDTYEGYWKDEKRNGEGTYYWSNGKFYKGNWLNDARSGEGIMYFTDGSWLDGLWENDLPNGYGFYYDANDNYLYVGEFVDGVRTGIFTIYDNTSKTVIGTYDYGNQSSSSTTPNNSSLTSAEEGYYEELAQLQDNYSKMLEEIYEKQSELNEYLNKDPLSTEEGKAILNMYNFSGSAGNGGNIDSFSAANAARQQAALKAQAEEAAIKAYNAKVSTLKSLLDDLRETADNYYNTQLRMIQQKYGIYE